MSHQCPSCDREFDSRRGKSIHHYQSHGESIRGVESKCEYCGCSYSVKPRRCDETKFCSIECNNKWKSENQIGKNNPNWKGGVAPDSCDWCGGKYTPHRRNSGQRFCSRKCMGEWESKNQSGKGHWNWSGGYSIYYGHWDKEKKYTRNRDGMCVLCGETTQDHISKYGQNPDVHHIIPVTVFKDPKDSHFMLNLITLCRPCHRKVESSAWDIETKVLLALAHNSDV